MSRAAKWKVDKTKVKVVFRLQFNATHVPQTGWNNLFISFVPLDSGKATAKTNKASVRNGSCKWSDPIYETTRLLQDSKTKQFEEKIYKLLVAMGTSRSSVLGEATINLSDYVDALKPTVVAFPLQGNDLGAMLHVTVQLLTSKTGFREFEQQREVSDRGLQTNSDHNSGKFLTTGDVAVARPDKVSPRLKSKPEPKELPSLEKEPGINEDYADSAAGFDGSSNTSGSLCLEKHEISSSREIDSVKSGGLSPTKSGTDHQLLRGGTSDWVHLNDGEIAMVYEENNRLREALEVADVSIHELRKEISSLQSCADDIGIEAQNLTKKISIEIADNQGLVKEISVLRSECSKFKSDLDWLKSLKLNLIMPRTNIDQDQYDMSLRWIKGLQVAEDKIKEVHEKMVIGFSEMDSKVLSKDLEALLTILHDLKQGNVSPIYQVDDRSIGKAKPSDSNVIADTGLGVDLCHPEGVLLPGLGSSSVDPTNAMQGEIFKLLRELDESKSEKEGLLRKMDQMECYYEALIQELEENQKQILGELQNLRNEHSSCIYTLSSTKAQMEAMHQQMSNELLQLAEERCNLDVLNKELERRALSSESALRRARLNYSIAVNQLQKDLGLLSLQVHSMYETNETLIRRAFMEVSEDEGSDLVKVMVSQSESPGVKSQLMGSDRLLEDLKRSLALQEELYGKIQEEVSEILLANVQLDVFLVTLHENLELSLKENENLKVKLGEITEQVVDLSEEKVRLFSRCNDLALENEKLEENVKRIHDEKVALDVKIGDIENLLSEYKSYKNDFEICNAEKLELMNLLERATLEKVDLSNEVSLLQEELTSMKGEVFSLVKDKEDLLNEHDITKHSLTSAKSEVEVIKQKFKHDLEDMVSNLNASTTLVENLQENLEIIGEKLKLSTEEETKYMRMTQDLVSDFAKMEASLEELNFMYKDLGEEIMALGNVTEGNKLTIDRITQENLSLNDILLNKTKESDMLKLELDNLKENARSLKDELDLLREVKGNLEADVSNLNAQLKDRDEKLSYLDQKNGEIIKLKKIISEMESEKEDLYHKLSNYEDNLKKKSDGFADLEIQLMNMHGLVITTDITCTFIMNQYKVHIEDLVQKLEYSNQLCRDFERRSIDLTSTLNTCLARNEIFSQENTTLLSNLESLRSELDSYVASNRDIKHTELESLLDNCRKENDDLILQKEEIEIRFLMLKALMEERGPNYDEQITMLKKQCSDLTRKLSEQVLKTEEFKNLSIHLKELQEEKKENEGSSIAMQESLRIAFIKEQYESKVHELKYQLSLSKKHGEEMLWKLQDAIDELETRKKCEASLIKRNEELQSKIVDLEAELQSVISENRERFMAYEQLKAELECSVMSLDCCKEEKKQLTESLHEINVEKGRLSDEIELMREQIENLKAFMTSPVDNKVRGLTDTSVLTGPESLNEGISRSCSDDQGSHLSQHMTLEIESDDEKSMKSLPMQDDLVSKASEGSLRDSEHTALHHDHMKSKNLLECIERLQKELDVMRNENNLLKDENANGLDSEGLQREHMHLDKVTKELGEMSSIYNDSSRSGNSVERVLALELELAEALQAKKSTIQFQSSFLKLHSDEAAIFQSFRDINELIKDMLEMKERYGTIEAELKEMHERYSQLSLDFAEVEGERQKLTMMLKNTRSSKRLLSSPQSPKDLSP